MLGGAGHHTSSTHSDHSPIDSTNTNTITPTSTTNPKSLKSCLRNGETLYGLFLLSFSPTFAEIAGLSSYDFVVIDMEQGLGSISNAPSSTCSPPLPPP